MIAKKIISLGMFLKIVFLTVVSFGGDGKEVKLPDLIPFGFRLSSNEVSVKVQNLYDAPEVLKNVKVTFSHVFFDKHGNRVSEKLKDAHIKELPCGGMSKAVRVTARLPATISYTDKAIEAVVDPDNAIEEASEKNNTANNSVKPQVSAGADMYGKLNLEK